MLPCGVIHLCLYLCQFSTRLWGQGSGSESSCSSGGVSKNSPLVKRLQVRWLIGCKEKLQGERLLAPWPFTVSLFSLGRVPTTPVNPQRILLTFWLDPTVRSLPAGRRGAGGTSAPARECLPARGGSPAPVQIGAGESPGTCLLSGCFSAPLPPRVAGRGYRVGTGESGLPARAEGERWPQVWGRGLELGVGDRGRGAQGSREGLGREALGTPRPERPWEGEGDWRVTLGRRRLGGRLSRLGECPGTWQRSSVRVAWAGKGWLAEEVWEQGVSPSLRVVGEKDSWPNGLERWSDHLLDAELLLPHLQLILVYWCGFFF